MRKAVLIIILLLVAGGVLVYPAVKKRMRTDLAFNSKVSAILDKVYAVRDGAVEAGKNIGNIFSRGENMLSDTIKGAASGSSGQDKSVELQLKHGGVIKGRLLKETSDQYVVDWSGSEFTVKKKDVKSFKVIARRDINWPYKNDIVVVKTNGVVCDGKIIGLDDQTVTLSFEEGTGGMEMGVPRSDISYLLFAPFYSKEAEETEEHLKKLFPKMKVYKEGNITLFTDSYAVKAKWCQKIARTIYTDIYFKFFDIFKDKKPQFQNFIVMFDDPIKYIDSTGMPPYIPGYFDPVEKVLYLYNMFGERIEEILFSMLVEATGTVNKYIDKVKKDLNIDKRYDIFIDGKTKEFTDRFWKVQNMYKTGLIDDTKSVLRHELTHEIFNNWGFQGIIISKPEINKDKLLEKRKAFIEACDWKQKRKLLDDMMKMEKSEDVKMVVAESWLAEGIATYCATDPIGAIDEDMLFTYQDAVSKKELEPIEFFTSFEKGSFIGVSLKSKYNLYAQSWSFTRFLMDKYPAQFAEYQKEMSEKMAHESKKEAQEEKDNLTMLLACLNKDLPTLEKEFNEYMLIQPKMTDPFVKRYMENYEIWQDLLDSHY